MLRWEISVDTTWPLFGLNAIFLGIAWSMKRGARERREQLIARRPPVVSSPQRELPPHAIASHAGELHCPHCGHTIDDRDFARQHAPMAYWPARESPYF